jgi:hypothetical protein
MVVAVLVAVIIVIAGALILTSKPSSSSPNPLPTLSLGPKVVIVPVAGTGSRLLPLSNNTPITIQLFASVPSAFETPGTSLTSPTPHIYPVAPRDQTDNGVNDEVSNVTLLPGSNVSAFFLSPAFMGIAQAWSELLSHDTGINEPSLPVEAVKTVVANGTAALYLDYNNLPYLPTGLNTVTLNATQLGSGVLGAWFQGTAVDPGAYSRITLGASALNLSLVFPHQPTQVVRLPTVGVGGTQTRTPAVRTPCAITGTTCYTSYFESYPSVTSTELMRTSYLYGVLPLLGVHIDRYADGGGPLIDNAASVSITNDTMDLNSAEPYLSSSGQLTTTMSTSPSSAHVANVTAGTSISAIDAWPTAISRDLGANQSTALNYTTDFLGIQGAEYEFQNYHQVTHDCTDQWERVCCVHPNGNVYCTNELLSQTLTSSVLDANYTAGSIVNSNSTAGLKVTAEQVSIWAAWAIQHFLGADSNGSFTLSTSGPDSSYSASTIWARTTGYLNATNAYGAAASALGAFSTALGLGLALVDATAATHGVDFDASEPAVVAETAELITDAIGMSAQILAQFNSISAWTGTNTVTFTYGLFNDPAPHPGGSNYTVRFFESQEPVSFILPGGNACSSYAPVNFMNATAIV